MIAISEIKINYELWKGLRTHYFFEKLQTHDKLDIYLEKMNYFKLKLMCSPLYGHVNLR